MAAKLIRLTHKIAIQLHLMAESSTICSSRSRWSVRELLYNLVVCALLILLIIGSDIFYVPYIYITTSIETAEPKASTQLTKGRRRLRSGSCVRFIQLRYYLFPPDPMAALSKARTVFDRSNIGIAGSNPALGMDVCPRFSVLCCAV
jgi:hypothetical protein